ncbi:MAG: hypothetical protein GY715_21875 [Planctomycetes bacterium]|nr:hypothetical protein [Planctomycetota bacterium]
MRPRKGTTIATYGLLCLAGGISFVMPEAIDVPPVPAVTPVPVRVVGPAEAPEEEATTDIDAVGRAAGMMRTIGTDPQESRAAFALCP